MGMNDKEVVAIVSDETFTEKVADLDDLYRLGEVHFVTGANEAAKVEDIADQTYKLVHYYDKIGETGIFLRILDF